MLTLLIILVVLCTIVWSEAILSAVNRFIGEKKQRRRERKIEYTLKHFPEYGIAVQNAPKKKNGKINYDALLSNPKDFAVIYEHEKGVSGSLASLDRLLKKIERKIAANTTKIKQDREMSAVLTAILNAEINILNKRKANIHWIINEFRSKHINTEYKDRGQNQNKKGRLKRLFDKGQEYTQSLLGKNLGAFVYLNGTLALVCAILMGSIAKFTGMETMDNIILVIFLMFFSPTIAISPSVIYKIIIELMRRKSGIRRDNSFFMVFSVNIIIVVIAFIIAVGLRSDRPRFPSGRYYDVMYEDYDYDYYD